MSLPEPERIDDGECLPERIGDPMPAPPDWMIAEAVKKGINKAADRPWLPAPHPIGGKVLRMGCSCSGKMEFKRHMFQYMDNQGRPDGRFPVWLGQCSKCQAVFWSVET